MKLAVWYHCRLSGGYAPIDTDAACRIMTEQMAALKQSGLLDAVDEFYIGINGDNDDAQIARMLCPFPQVKILANPPDVQSEIPTLNALRSWLPKHPDWYVLYHHIKGVTHPTEALYTHWRHCMERAVVRNWRRCVADLDAGFDSVGCHWMTPQQFGLLVKSCYWGGTFWWTKAQFLLTLPPFPMPTSANRFEAENWIGRGPRLPKVNDYHPGWPSMRCK